MSIFSDYENGYMDDYDYREECKRMNRQGRYEKVRLYEPLHLTDNFDFEEDEEEEDEDRG